MQSQKRQNDLCSFPRQTTQYHSNPAPIRQVRPRFPQVTLFLVHVLRQLRHQHPSQHTLQSCPLFLGHQKTTFKSSLKSTTVSFTSGPPLKLYPWASLSRYWAIAEWFLKKHPDNLARLVQALGTLPTSRNSPLWTSVFSSVKWDHPAHYPGPCEDTIRWFTPNSQLTALPGTLCLSYLLKSASPALGLDAVSTFHETFHFMNPREKARKILTSWHLNTIFLTTGSQASWVGHGSSKTPQYPSAILSVPSVGSALMIWISGVSVAASPSVKNSPYMASWLFWSKALFSVPDPHLGSIIPSDVAEYAVYL